MGSSGAGELTRMAVATIDKYIVLNASAPLQALPPSAQSAADRFWSVKLDNHVGHPETLKEQERRVGWLEANGCI